MNKVHASAEDVEEQMRNLRKQGLNLKEIAREIAYNKVEAVNIVDDRLKVVGIPRTRPRVVNITDLSRVQRINWVTAKARIRN